MKLIPNYPHDSHSTFWALAKLAFPQGRADVLADPHENPTRPSPRRGVMLPPDEQLVCYDYLYYLCALEVRSYPSSLNLTPLTLSHSLSSLSGTTRPCGAKS